MVLICRYVETVMLFHGMSGMPTATPPKSYQNNFKSYDKYIKSYESHAKSYENYKKII